jgi:hypothetical protein
MSRPDYEATSNVTVPPAPPPAIPDDGSDPVPVFVTTGVRTSDGPGPGVKHLPPAEASRLVNARVAVAGDKPPRGWNLEA